MKTWHIFIEKSVEPDRNYEEEEEKKKMMIQEEEGD